MLNTVDVTTAGIGAAGLRKVLTGIEGFDELTVGGLPAGRPTLVCGAAGSGKSLFALQFLTGGALHHGEPGVLLALEESRDDVATNVASLGLDVDALERSGDLLVDAVRLDAETMVHSGEFDLEALFTRLAWAVGEIGAKRVAIDGVEALFAAFSDDQALIRSELRRMCTWVRDHELTTVITGERGDGRLTRHGIEEYVTDCVVALDHRVVDEVSTRRLRVVKYRGTVHGCNEYPFLIGEQGIEVLPITSLALEHEVSTERFATGVHGLDDMLGGRGLYRGSSVLVSGAAGTGKSTVAATIVDESCRRGERALYFGFEESPAQTVRNMRAVGVDLQQWVDQGLLEFHCHRPTTVGLETHLAMMRRAVLAQRPAVVVVDPISSFRRGGAALDVTSMLTRQIDFLKGHGITALLTALADTAPEHTEQEVSSLVDTWMLLKTLEGNGERNRGLFVLKSRGMAHSNQIREFLITDEGLRLVPAYVGRGEVLSGSARAAQEAAEAESAQRARSQARDRASAIERRRQLIEAQVAALWAEFEVEATREQQHIDLDQAADKHLERARREQAALRGVSMGA